MIPVSSNGKTEVIVFPSIKKACVDASERFLALFRQAIQVKGIFTAALSGGRTPKLLYETLAKISYKDKLDWDKVHLFQSDERCVPMDHSESNARMIREILVSRIKLPEANAHWMINNNSDWKRSAKDYERTVRKVLNAPKGIPIFDLILLGLGEDGHTASLFEGSRALYEKKRLVVPNFVPQLNSWRITYTLPLINRAKNIIFLVGGKEKKEVFSKLFDLRSQIPAKNVSPVKGNLKFLIDESVIK